MVNGEIISNDRLKGDYFVVKFHTPEIAAKAVAGQFVHVQITQGRDYILRRPFSIHRVDGDTLTVVYKVVGKGTEILAARRPGDVCDLLGPLGRGFSVPSDDVFPVLVAGGYGAAATYLLTRQAEKRGCFLLGARSEADILLVDSYKEAGYDVRLATNDGSIGHKGFVTELIDGVLKDYPNEKFFFYGCGPHPMLMALAKLLNQKELDGQLSIDHLMCCGVGACFACVVKMKADNADGWEYKRACHDGPVFDLNDVYLGD